MKKIYTLLLSVISSQMLFAQSAFEVKDINGNLIGNTTININIDYFDQISYVMDVKNISSNSKDVKLKKQVISDLSGSNITMCTGINCWSPNTLIVPVAVNLNPNTSLLSLNQEFHAVFQPFGNLGNAVVKFTVFEDGGNDSVSVTFNFNSIILSNKPIVDNKPLKVNISKGLLVVDNETESEYTLELFDLTGKKLVDIKSTQSQLKQSIQEATLYLLRYKHKGKYYTKKISVN